MFAVMFCAVFSTFFTGVIISELFDLTRGQTALWVCIICDGAVLLEMATGCFSGVMFGAMDVPYPTGRAQIQRAIKKYIPPEYLPKDLKIKIVNTNEENAYAWNHNTVGFTTGFLQTASDREIAGVLAHELGHVKLRHTLQTSINAGLLAPGFLFSGAFVFLVALALLALFDFLFSQSREDEFSLTGWGMGIGMMVLISIVTLIIRVQSRRNEYAADDYAASISPDVRAGLTSWFRDVLARVGPEKAGLFDTHPLLRDRLARLERS